MEQAITIRTKMAYTLITISMIVLMAAFTQSIHWTDASFGINWSAKLSFICGILSICMGILQLNILAHKVNKRRARLMEKDILMGARQFIMTIGQILFFSFIFI